MGLFDRFFGRHVELDPAARQRLETWRARPEPGLSDDFRATRLVVVDVETTGLDLARDRLIAIGACAVENGQVVMVDSFEIVLRQDKTSTKDNILIHGIGGEAQRDGLEPAEALLRFLDFLGKSPLVAFHVTFDQTMIKKAVKEYLGFEFKHPWLDLAYVMPGLLPEHARRYRAGCGMAVEVPQPRVEQRIAERPQPAVAVHRLVVGQVSFQVLAHGVASIIAGCA